MATIRLVMTDAPFDIVPYAPELEQEVLALCRRAWPDEDVARADFQRWQYIDNPAGPALSTLARDRATGEVIGQFGAIPVRLSVEGEERLAALALNVVTDEAQRGRGVFTALGRAADQRMAERGATIAFAMPNENSFPGFVRRLGYTHAGDVPFLVRPVNVRRLVARRLPLPGLGLLAALLLRPFVPPVPRTHAPVQGVAVDEVEEFDEAFDSFWRRVRGREPVMLVRDRPYLTWRFRQLPTRAYTCLRATVDGEQAGYLVLRAAGILGYRAGLVVDFLIEPSAAGERAGRALLAHALASFAREDLDLLASLMPAPTPEYRLLRRTGFRPLPRALLPQPFRLVARDGPVVRDARRWFFTMGDYDVV